ncbi:TonB-dependent siderophore receptor [Hyphomicrobium sp.]|uniref:TonB-dependent receptor plug domain-containing protein n=1 Tax=Hyphomicrobium sp. TaxID=82 RepID=UPI000FC30AB5|nr:TonB-dependent receptor [Hyphomicrobium sp.]RUO98462.1 MAG: TonB-dependent receptor [Hyphomicrobium sp.]
MWQALIAPAVSGEGLITCACNFCSLSCNGHVELTDPDRSRYDPDPTRKAAKSRNSGQQISTPSASASGSSGTQDPGEIAVSPTGTPEPVDQIGSSVTVITSKQIEAQQRRTLPDVLKMVPGLNVVQTGGPGGQTSVFMRGTNSNHTKVLIDGIDVSDPSTPNRTFDFGQMLAMDLERVEVLRGPQSGLYGADALGGVILIYTKRGNGPPKVNTMVEGGSFGTFNQAASVSGGTDRYNYYVNISHFRADDIPVTPKDLLQPGEPRFANRYDNWTYSSKVGVDVTKDVTVNLVARYTDGTIHFTGDSYDPFTHSSFPSPYQSGADVDDFYSRSEVVWRSLGGNLTNYFGINYSNSQTDNIDHVAGNSYYQGDRVKYDWRSVLKIAPGYALVTGAEHQNEQLNGPDVFAGEWNNGVYSELQAEVIHNLFVATNVRYDDNENFGGHTTWRVAPTYLIEATGTKIKGSIGTGFKAPSLSQRFQDYPAFFFYGNPDLKPEENTGYDVGFEQQIFGGCAQFGATYFRNDLTDLIETTYDPTTFISTYANVGKAKTDGVEAFVAADLTTDLRMRADYTYTQATNEDSGGWLLRRPHNKASVALDWTPTDKLLVTGSVLYYGDSLDIDRATFADEILPSFTVVNVAADYKLTDRLSVYGRIDNLFNEHYEIPDGFLATGIGAYAGIRFTN